MVKHRFVVEKNMKKIVLFLSSFLLTGISMGAWTERYVNTNATGSGDGTSEATAWTLAQATTSASGVSGSMRVNIQTGTYTLNASNLIFSVVAYSSAPVWWRGYNTTIGDIDTNNSLSKPVFIFTTGGVQFTQPFQIFSEFVSSGANTTSNGLSVVSSVGAPTYIDRCQFTNTQTNANSSALLINGSAVVTRSYFSVPTNGSQLAVQIGADCYFAGNYVVGGSSNARVCGGGGQTVSNNVFINAKNIGVFSFGGSNRNCMITYNTIDNAGTAGIQFNGLPADGIIANNLITNSGTYGINFTSAASSVVIKFLGNDFYNNASGNYNGWGDNPDIGGITESVSPYTNESAGDYSLLSTANAKAGAQPGTIENTTLTSYPDNGALQRQEPVAGGGTVAYPFVQ